MKPLFLLGRARRSVSTLETEFQDFARRIGQSPDSALMCGDLVFWPLISVSEEHGDRAHHPVEFWNKHRNVIESGLLSETVIGEIGQNMLSSSETQYIDRFQDHDFMYGTEDPSAASSEEDGDEDDWFDPFELDDNDGPDPYANRLFWTVDAQSWFDDIEVADSALSFGRKLMVIIGREAERRFLDSSTGGKLRARLGERASVVFNSQHADVVVIAFEHHDSPSDLFEHIKRLMPPRLVEDFLIVDIGMKYCTGSEPISLFGNWAERLSNRRGDRAPQRANHQTRPREMTPRRKVIVEKVKRPKIR